MEKSKTVTTYKEVGILPAHSGFGMYQLGEANGDAWLSEHDLMREIADSWINFLPIGEALSNADFIAAGVEDIRGKIYGGDPYYLFAGLAESPNGGVETNYFGIIKIVVSQDHRG